MKPLMLIQAPVQTRSGYGEHARDLVRCLIRMDKFDIKIWGTRWGETPFIDLNTDRDKEIHKRLLKDPNLPKQPEIHFQVAIPNEFMKVAKYNIGVTAGIETTHCSRKWIEGANNVDLMIVPSEHAKKVFDSTTFSQIDEQTKKVLKVEKVTTPIEVLFEGADTSIYYETSNIKSTIRFPLNEIKEQFAFLFVGHWLKGDFFQDRKDLAGLMKVFLETFKNIDNPPALVLKSSMATLSVMDRMEMLRRIDRLKKAVSSDKELPNIYLLHGDLTEEEMNGLYNHSKVKAHISFTKGEGFGRPLLEASLSGKPVIAPAWSGPLDFLHKDYSVLLPGQITQVHPSAVWDDIIIAQSGWFTVNYTVASNIMMQVWKNYKHFKARSEQQKEHSRINFSLDKMYEKFTELMEKHLPEFPKELKVNIPNFGDIKLPKLKPLIASSEAVKEGMDAIDAKQMDLPAEKTEEETRRVVEEVYEKTDNEPTESTG